MDYGAILGRAWQVITRHKVLWLFGILAALGSGAGNGTSYNVSSDQAGDWVARYGEGPMIALACVGAFVGLLLLAIVIALTTMGHIGLVKGALAAEAGAEQITFGAIWSDSRPYFWRMLGLVILLIVIAVVGAIGILLALGLLAITIVGLVIVVPVICLLVLAIPLVAGYVSLATVSVVADDVGPMDALGRAWQLVRQKLVEVWAMGVVLFVLFLIVALIAGLAMGLLMAPVAILGAVVHPAAWLLGLLLIPVALLIGGIVQAYTTTVWTLVHQRLAMAGGGTSGYLPAA